MRLLFFSVSLLFALIFYSFHQLSLGKDMYGMLFTSAKNFPSISGNLLYESMFFLLSGVLLVVLFSSFGRSEKNNYFFFWAFFLTLLIFPYFFRDSFILGAAVFFISGELLFRFLSELDFFREQKLPLKYFGLFLNLLAVFIAMYYLKNIAFSLILVSLLCYSSVFHLDIHKKYVNYLSLFVSISISIFLLFFCLFFIYSHILTFF